jgi:hypothetical protein
VGGDWNNYLKLIETNKYQTLFQALTQTDPSYAFLSWVSANLNFGPYFVNLICAAIFTYGLIFFSRSQPQPWLAIAISFPYLITVVAMGYTRQSVAIGLVMIALVYLEKFSYFKFLLYIFFASTFHKSAIILLPLAFLSFNKNLFNVLIYIIFFIFTFYFLLLDYIENLISGYLLDKYDSSGALIRVLMNFLPATLFLIYRKRFNLNLIQRSFWTSISLSALFFI